MPDVTDADRKAAAEVVYGFMSGGLSWYSAKDYAGQIKSGQLDQHSTVQAFARHAAQAKAERTAEIVAMIREEAGHNAETLQTLRKIQTLTAAQSDEWDRQISIFTGLATAIEEKYRAD